MVIKCNNISGDMEGVDMINYDLAHHVSIGDKFTVFGFSIINRINYFYIFNGEHLIEVPCDFFEIVSNNCPPNWKIKFDKNGDLTFWPELFYEESFLENFAERRELERNQFAELERFINHA